MTTQVAVSHTVADPPDSGRISLLVYLTRKGDLDVEEIVNLLKVGQPETVEEYSEHIYKIMTLLNEGKTLDPTYSEVLKSKLFDLFDCLEDFVDGSNPIHSKLYLIIEQNFDNLVKSSVNSDGLDIGSQCIRFLTSVIMNLNYWEIYNLLSWKPAIYHFLTVIQYDINDCYARFVEDYSEYCSNQEKLQKVFEKKKVGGKRRGRKPKRFQQEEFQEEPEFSPSPSETPFSPPADHFTSQTSMDDGYANQSLKSLVPKHGEKILKFAEETDYNPSHKVIKKTNSRPSNKSSNYDPDVVHECQLPSADEPDKACLRRFSRKYELIRHQETVHSKKKRLYKCFVCVKQNPAIGPRIFTRHDTLAKHIRVNHKISGKEAKAEVAYSKKHAEVVEDGDITIHVGRRKTKVNFELRAHMEKRKLAKELGDGEYFDDMDLDDTSNSIIVDEIDEEDEDEDSYGGQQTPSETTSKSPQQMTAQEQYEHQYRQQLLAQHQHRQQREIQQRQHQELQQQEIKRQQEEIQQQQQQQQQELQRQQAHHQSMQQLHSHSRSHSMTSPQLAMQAQMSPKPSQQLPMPPNMYHSQFQYAPLQHHPGSQGSSPLMPGLHGMPAPGFVSGQSQFQVTMPPQRTSDGRKMSIQVSKDGTPVKLPPIMHNDYK